MTPSVEQKASAFDLPGAEVAPIGIDECAPVIQEIKADLDENPAIHAGCEPGSASAEELPEALCKGAPKAAPQQDPDAGLDSRVKGLLHYKKWWFFREVDLSVNGELLTGTPIILHEQTLRVVNDDYSYFIPMRNVDYIRTPDGLRMAISEFDEPPFHFGRFDD